VQELKAIENKCVFNQDLKVSTEGADLMSGGFSRKRKSPDPL